MQPTPVTRSGAKRSIKRLLLLTVVVNAVAFLALALIRKLNVEGKALVFVGFWGQLTAYSFWFVGRKPTRSTWPMTRHPWPSGAWGTLSTRLVILPRGSTHALPAAASSKVRP